MVQTKSIKVLYSIVFSIRNFLQEKAHLEAESRAAALQDRVKDLEKQLSVIQERCTKLLNIEKEHCLDYLPSKGMSNFVVLFSNIVQRKISS